MMALNTTLKCSRIGETGKPLASSPSETAPARHPSGKSAALTLGSLEGLLAAAGSWAIAKAGKDVTRKAAAVAEV